MSGLTSHRQSGILSEGDSTVCLQQCSLVRVCVHACMYCVRACTHVVLTNRCSIDPAVYSIMGFAYESEFLVLLVHFMGRRCYNCMRVHSHEEASTQTQALMLLHPNALAHMHLRTRALTYTHPGTHVHTHTCTHVLKHSLMRALMPLMHSCTHAVLHTRAHIQMHTHMCAHTPVRPPARTDLKHS